MASAILLGLLGCSDSEPQVERDVEVVEEDSGPEFVAWERPSEGSGGKRWVRGDLHVHASGASNDAVPESTHERIKEVAIERRLDFVVLTDHSNSTGSDPWTLDEDPELFNQGPEFPFWDEVAELSNESFILVQGNELSPVNPNTNQPTGHIGCIPRSLQDFDPDIAFVDRPRGEVTGGEALEQAKDSGCLTILNHPYGPRWISFDWTGQGYDAMEVWNGGAGFGLYDEQGMQAWACDLSQGRKVTPIGASDNHDVEMEPPGELLTPPLGVPVTWVWTAELDWEEIIDGLSQGRVAISDTGAPLEIDLFDEEGRWMAMAGGEVDEAQELWIQIRGARKESDGSRNLKLIKVLPDACDDRREEGRILVPEPNWEVLQTWSIDSAGEFEERFEVSLAEGEVLFAWMVPESIELMGRDAAISGAIYAR